MSTASPASSWARRLAPGSRAINAATMMTQAPAKMVSRRSAGNEPGKMAWSTLAKSGVIGGEAAEPKARGGLGAREENSARGPPEGAGGPPGTPPPGVARRKKGKQGGGGLMGASQ